MYRALIAKNIAYAAKVGGGTIAGINEIDLLDEGAVAIFTENNTLVTTATSVANLLGTQQFWMAVGAKQVNPKTGGVVPYIYKSYLIDRDAHIQEYCTYVAPVLQKVVIGKDGAGAGAMNFPTLVAGDSAVINVIETSESEFQPGFTKRYEHIVTSTDTASTIIQSLVDAINNNDDSIVVASVLTNGGSNVGILLTAKTLEGTFTVGTDGIAFNATKAYSGGSASVVNYGKGTPTILFNLEKKSQINSQGNSNYQMYNEKFFGLSSLVNPSGTYNTWNFGWHQEARANGINHMSVTQQEVLLAVPSGATTLLANLVTMFGVLFLGQTTGSGSSSV
jgi:hypothetical protein